MTANVQVIERDGVPEYAVTPYEEYEELVRLSEQMRDIQAYDAAMADAGETVPHAVMQRLVNGDSPLRVWREYRALTQAALARKAGIDKTYLSQIETGRKQGSVEALAQLASALSVVDTWIGSQPETSPSERHRRAIEAAGRFSSGKQDVAERHDEYLADAFGQ